MTRNNLDLIRLLAALQVVLAHGFYYTEGSQDVIEFLRLIPGVQIFFAISGYLIYQSYGKTSDLREYARNRVLRLYPGLIACFMISVGAVFAVGYLTVPPPEFGLWAVAQLTVAQFYNPAFMRGFGTGVLNGALWTITVEIQFYVLTPIVHRLVSGDRRRLLYLIAAFMLPNLLYIFTPADQLWHKLLGVTFLPWFYIFLFGAYLSHRTDIIDWMTKRVLLIGPIYLVVAYVAYNYIQFGHNITPFFLIPLLLVVFGLAFRNRDLAARLLHRNDISYGMYIYHLPVLNTLFYLGVKSVPLIVAFTLVFATASWFLVEKPALSAKRISLRPI